MGGQAINQSWARETSGANIQRKRLLLGVVCGVETSSTWLQRATKRSKKSWLPLLYISSCIVPLFLKVERLRMMRAR